MKTRKILVAIALVLCIFILVACSAKVPQPSVAVTKAVSEAAADEERKAAVETVSAASPEAETVEGMPEGYDQLTNTEKEAINALMDEDFEFSFKDIDGKTYDNDTFKGKMLILNYWATWCGYCIQEMPHLDEVANSRDDVRILAVNTGEENSKESQKKDILKAMEQYKLPVVFDEDGASYEKTGSTGLPTSLFFDETGKLRYVLPGAFASKEQLESAIDTIKKLSPFAGKKKSE